MTLLRGISGEGSGGWLRKLVWLAANCTHESTVHPAKAGCTDDRAVRYGDGGANGSDAYANVPTS
jgi:hypothetical protein